ncbi:MAG: two-component regulator propeller domain-containing protein, partial [Bacteroidota bacterium]
MGNLKNVSVTCLLEFTPNEIWVGTEKGLVLFSNDTLTQNNEALFFGEEYIRSISKNETGELCVLTKTKLFKQNKQTRQWEKILELVNPDESFQDFWSRPAGYWYTTTAGGIRTSDSLNCPIPTILKPYFETAEIMFTQIDVFAEKVFFSSRSGVLYFNQQTIETNFFSTTNGLDNSDARCVLVDREGNPWIATYGGGLYKYLGNAIRTYNQFDGLAGNAVMTMFKQNNNLFFGTFENGITANYTTLNNPLASKLISGLKNETRIWTSAIDAQGRPWVGTLNGVYFFEENCNSCPKWVNINSENNGLNENLVLSLLPVKAGMYVGTNKGIQLINENSITSFNHLANYPGTRIRHMIETKNGHIWMATREGITRFDGKSFQS